VSGDGGLAGLRRRLAELRAALENPRPKKQRRGRRGGRKRAAVGDVPPMSSAGAGGRAFSAAGRSLDAAGDRPAGDIRIRRGVRSAAQVWVGGATDVAPFGRFDGLNERPKCRAELMSDDVNDERDDVVAVDELAARRWKRGERERVEATFADAEVRRDRREALD
jgi:hypothetical protein